MKPKKDDDVNEENNLEKQKEEELSIDEQIEIYAELIVDQLIKQLNEK